MQMTSLQLIQARATLVVHNSRQNPNATVQPLETSAEAAAFKANDSVVPGISAFCYYMYAKLHKRFRLCVKICAVAPIQMRIYMLNMKIEALFVFTEKIYIK